MVRELGLERRETVWFLSTINVRKLKEANLITQGPGKIYLWCVGYFYQKYRRVATYKY